MGPRIRNGISRRLERHCSSGPIKLGIFDINRSTSTRSNCLGLSSSIFKWVFSCLLLKIEFIFGCKIVHVLCFAVTHFNIAYFVKIECSTELFDDKLCLITYFKMTFNSKYYHCETQKVFIFLLRSKIKISTGKNIYYKMLQNPLSVCHRSV